MSSEHLASNPPTRLPRGASMDRPVSRRIPRWLGPALAIVAAVIGAITGYIVWGSPQRTLIVEPSRLALGEVTRGRFEDYIPIRGRVEPARTIFLDAVEGGLVEDVHVEDGASVEAGQLLVDLSNTSLQLEVLAREAQVVEQLNIVRTQELQLERNRLEHKRNLVEIRYNIKRLTRAVQRQDKLRTHIPVAEVEQTEDELEYWTQRRDVTREAQKTDDKLQKAQVAQLKAAAARLQQNLALAQKNLEGLSVRAPVAGRLTALNAEVGQSLTQGERIGQIDDPTNFKMTALIDEFYLPRVEVGQAATVQLANTTYALTSRKIYPQVRNGQFEVDFMFNDKRPTGIRRGQTLQAKLSLGDPSETLLVPNGAFYQDTGGQWAFVVANRGHLAVRRDIRLGRRNPRFIEVLDGLHEGEQVVTSPYTNYRDLDRLELTSTPPRSNDH